MTGRLLRHLQTLLLLAVLLVGVPVVLVTMVGWPLPDHWPSRAQWRQAAEQPLTRTVALDAAVCVAWLLWAALSMATVVGWLRRGVRVLRRGVRLPALPTPMQATASGLMGATLLSPGHPSPPAAPPPPPPSPTAAVFPHSAPPATAAHSTSETRAVPTATVASGRADVDDQRPGAHTTPPVRAQGAGTGGVWLPDGQWVNPALAAAVAAAATRIWQHRRTNYRPRRPGPARRDDPDLTPLPGTVTTIQHRLQPPPESHDPDQPATVAPPSPGPARLGLPAGGLGLTGPGAAHAARALMAAVLLPPSTSPLANTAAATTLRSSPDTARAGAAEDQLRLVTTRTALNALLPGATQVHPAGAHVAVDVAAALAVAEREALARSSTPGRERPPILLLLDPPPADWDRLQLLAALAARLGLTTVILGDWPPGPTWQIDTDGSHHTATSAHDGVATPSAAARPGGKLSMLGPAATLDLLTLCPAQTTAAGPPGHPADGHGASMPTTATASPHTLVAAPGDAGSAPVLLTLRVLGGPNVYPAGGGSPLRFGRSAALPLLTYLALYPHGATTHQLARALWPGLPAHTTANRIYTTLSTLRTVLDPAAGGVVIGRDGERYRLNPRHIDVDLWRLHRDTDTAASTTDPAERAAALRRVVDTGGLPLAQGWGWPWLDPHREATRRLVIDARTALAPPRPVGDPDPTPRL